MSKYIIVGTYSDEGAAGLVSGDTDRVEAMEALCDSVGAKLVSSDITRGLFDFCVMVEADSFEIIAAMLLKVRATGAIGEVITLEAVDYKSIRGIAKGVKYAPPNGLIVAIFLGIMPARLLVSRALNSLHDFVAQQRSKLYLKMI